MKKNLVGLFFSAVLCFLLFSSHVNAQVVFQQDGNFVGSRPIINCGENITCTQNPGQNRIDLKATVTSSTSGGGILSVSQNNLLTIVDVPVNTAAILLQQTIVLPTSGCPCRVIVDWRLVGNPTNTFASGNAAVSGWIDDGQIVDNIFATSLVRFRTSGGGFDGSSGSGVSLNTYSNSQTVTFSFKVQPSIDSINIVPGFINTVTSLSIAVVASN